MIEAHALDAWTRTADRSSTLFGYLMLVGGFAAPLFLWLAGVALALSGESALSRGHSRQSATKAIVARGAEIFILAFLFRLQAFIVSPGSAAVTIFRVDVLNVMGPGMAAAGVAWGVAGGRRRAAVVCALAATGLALVTPIVRQAAWVDELPIWFQWYLRPSGAHTTFTLLPWAGFVFAGATCGALLGIARARRQGRIPGVLGFNGIAVMALGYYAATLPSIYATSSFWTSSPTYFAIRVGVMMLALAALAALSLRGRCAPVLGVLERFGRNSLFIYWIHVELVYGYATWVVHRRLPIWGAICGYVAFCMLMHGMIGLRDRLVTSWRASRGAKRAQSPARSAQL